MLDLGNAPSASARSEASEHKHEEEVALELHAGLRLQQPVLSSHPNASDLARS